ncbi:metallophosphoesterase family protein [Calidifontibacillus erzurumensis]|uniref:Phosphoesterase n=1 Tax=Calidifontibacillus erzurumensis TaxID=2741433 RepID=A0A8J8K866_9BACI|nr:metallophosphoesterase [Calidifontibacillus erzurumensis]NSL51561.1 metallophosphoesterase [Calidifontibacillus erzurumensis]
MKVLIVSDSHGLKEELIELKNRYMTEVDAMIHCGDSELESSSNELSGFLVVKGNCDFDRSFPSDQLVNLNHLPFYITHGHLYNVKMTLLNLRYRAEEVGAKIVCFGHSHIAGAELIDGILFINPGSIRLPRMRKEKTYSILEIDDNKNAIVRFYSIDGLEIPGLKVACKIG